MADEDEWDRLSGTRGAPAETIEPEEREEPQALSEPLPPPPPRTVRDGRMPDPDGLVEGFAGSAAWQATLAVGDVLSPGFGSLAKAMHWADEVGFPVWSTESGLALDLSVSVSERRTLPRFTAEPAGDAWAHYDAEPRERPRPSVLRPYDGALVIDTLDPRRYHRAVSGPLSPTGNAANGPAVERRSPEGEDGVVIVADLAATGMRVADADALWRHALTVVTATLYDPGQPTSHARQVVRALRHVVFLDPALGLGLSLFVDEARVPWCPLVFAIDQASVRFLRA